MSSLIFKVLQCEKLTRKNGYRICGYGDRGIFVVSCSTHNIWNTHFIMIILRLFSYFIFIVYNNTFNKTFFGAFSFFLSICIKLDKLFAVPYLTMLFMGKIIFSLIYIPAVLAASSPGDFYVGVSKRLIIPPPSHLNFSLKKERTIFGMGRNFSRWDFSLYLPSK